MASHDREARKHGLVPSSDSMDDTWIRCFPRQRDPNGSIPSYKRNRLVVPAPESCGSWRIPSFWRPILCLRTVYIPLGIYPFFFLFIFFLFSLYFLFIFFLFSFSSFLFFSFFSLFSYFFLSPLPLFSCPSLRISECIGQRIRTGQQSVIIARGSGETPDRETHPFPYRGIGGAQLDSR